MILAQTRPLGLDVAGVGRVRLRDSLPRHIEVPWDAIVAHPHEVEVPRALEQVVGAPGGAVKDAGRVRRGGHRYEVPVVLLGRDILRLVDLQENQRGRTDDLRAAICRTEQAARPPEPDRRAEAPPETGIERLGERLLQAEPTGERLRSERRRRFDHLPAPPGVEVEKVRLEMGGEFVLPGLPGHHHCDRVSARLIERAEDRPHRVELIGTKRPADDVEREGRGIGEQAPRDPLALHRSPA